MGKPGDRGARGVRLNPKHDERTRAKIQTSQIINRLVSFVNGEVEMTAAQVTAGLGLLRKTLPDLSSVDLNATIDNKQSLTDFTDAELERIAGLGRKGSSEAQESTDEPGSIH